MNLFLVMLLHLPCSYYLLSEFLFSPKSFGRIKGWLEYAKSSPNLTVIAGGNCDDKKGYFVEPTIIETKDPEDKIMNEVFNSSHNAPKGITPTVRHHVSFRYLS